MLLRPHLLFGAALGARTGVYAGQYSKRRCNHLNARTRIPKKQRQKMRKPRDFQSERPTSVEEGTLTGSNGKSTEIERSKQGADRIDLGGGHNATLIVITPRPGPAEMARS
jgi:hypothetical protein